MEPLITIAIPVFNGEKTLAFAIKSVLAQTYKNWELFIVNDGSTDRSMDVANQFSNSRIQIVDDHVNKGLIARLNFITSIANGKYIARMDADDIMHPERLKRQVAFMEANHHFDVVDSAIYIINENNEVEGIRNTESLATSKASVLTHCLLTHPAVLGKKEWFIKYPYDPDYLRAEDYELWIRGYDNSKYGRVQEPLLFYREGNVNIRNYVNSSKSLRKIIRRYGPSLISNPGKRRIILLSYLKQWGYALFGFFKAQRLLVSFRSAKINQIEKEQAELIISKILN